MEGHSLAARVAVDVPLAHLDRLFDYTVPAELEDRAVPGARVKVPFAGRTRDGWLLERAEPDPEVKLAPLAKVVSAEPLMTPRLAGLVRAVADHYAGVFSDVARLAVPGRHAATETSPQREWPAPTPLEGARVIPRFDGGEALLETLAAGASPRVCWQVPPVLGGPGDLMGGALELMDATLRSGRGVLVVVPTARELDPLVERARAGFGSGAVGVLSADQGRGPRYRNFLAASRGVARIVVGTRSAIFAPVHDLGLVVVTDDGHDAHAEQRAPYPHSRSVAVLRTVREGCALVLASHARSTETQALVERGWLRELALSPGEVRRVSPPVRVVGDDPSREPSERRLRLPSAAFRFLRDQLPAGPVLVQVPRAGHSAGISCARCGTPATCPRCSTRLRAPERGFLVCPLCGHQPVRWSCSLCHGTQLRSVVAGALRTAEELARAFPGTPAVNSSAERPRTDVPDGPAIVVATPGAEPRPPSGYAGLLLLDTELMLSRPDLRVVEESVRRWCNAIALCRAPEDGGSVLAVGSSGEAGLQALVRGDVPGLARRELAERTEAGLPPAVKAVRVGGDPKAVADYLDNDPFTDVDIIGPTEVRRGQETEAAALLRVPLEQGRDLVARVRHAAAIRSARKEGGRLYVQVDPEVME